MDHGSADEDLRVVDADPLGDGTAVPIEVHEELRRTCPVARTPDGSFYLSRYEDVLKGLKSVDYFVGSFRTPGVVVPEEEKFISEIAEPRHGKIRKLLNSAITGHRLDGIEAYTAQLADELLDGLVGKGEVELVSEFLGPIPAAVICRLLGTDPADRHFWHKWSDEVAHDQYVRENRNERGQGLSGSFPEASERFDEMIRTRRDSPDTANDFIARLGQAEVDGERLTDLEMKMVIAFLFIAGNETTRSVLSHVLVQLATDEELFDRLKSDPRLVEPAFEECLRLHPPLPFLPRDCTDPVEIAGFEFNPGQRALFGLSSANRDEREFESPHELRLDRPDPRHHLTFGGGPHVCPGATLARIESRATIRTLLGRVSRIEPADGWQPAKEPLWWSDAPRDVRVRLVP